MVADPSLERVRETRQTTLHAYTGLPRCLPALIHPMWRLKKPQVLIGQGPLSGLEDAQGASAPAARDEKGRGEDSKNGGNLKYQHPHGVT